MIKMRWVLVSSKRHLGEHRYEPTEDLRIGDLYLNKADGCTYEWCAVDGAIKAQQVGRGVRVPINSIDDEIVLDFSRTPNSEKFVTDACNAQSKSVLDRVNSNWHERGELPPSGTECECSANNGEFKWCRIVHHSGSASWVVTKSEDMIIRNDLTNFRPLKSERERAIEEMLPILASLDGTQAKAEIACGELYDLGFRKEGK